MSGLESLAFVTGLASVWLALRLHVANWPLGLLSVACFAALFVEARRCADAVLQRSATAVDHPVQMRVAIENITNQRYWRDVGEACSANLLFPGAPRSLFLGLTINAL